MKPTLNCFLQTRQEVNAASDYVKANGVSSGLDCKNWDVYKIAPYLKDGDLLDMGSSGSVILENALKQGIKGGKFGIDLAYEKDSDTAEMTLIKGDLMNTPFHDTIFSQITCLSVVEHQVDFNALAKEVSRLLVNGGELFLSCDYWDPKPDTTKMKLYNLNWNVLDKKDILDLVQALNDNGLHLSGEIDWTLNEAVINPTYCSPADVSYTFGIFHFIKKSDV